MYISFKYVILYLLAGGITAVVTNSDRRAGVIGIIISALFGSTFGVAYAILSALEFLAGFSLVGWIDKEQTSRKQKTTR